MPKHQNALQPKALLNIRRVNIPCLLDRKVEKCRLDVSHTVYSE